MDNLLTEIEVMRVLDHKNIMKLYGVYEGKNEIHMILDYFEGGELLQRINEIKNFSEKKAIKIMRNLLNALEYLHDKNIVHRDLKPENLLLPSQSLECEDLVIADFGLASFIENGK